MTTCTLSGSECGGKEKRVRACGGPEVGRVGQGELVDFGRDLRPTGYGHGASGRPHTSRSTKAGTGSRERRKFRRLIGAAKAVQYLSDRDQGAAAWIVQDAVVRGLDRG